MSKARWILLLSALLLLLSGCREETLPSKPEVFPSEPVSDLPLQLPPERELENPDSVDPEVPLLCIAETREDAEKVASLYGITLVDYQDGVASFFTEEDPREVLQRGKAQGWPELSLNRQKHLS